MNLDRRSFLITSVTAAQTAFAQTSGERTGTAMIGTGNRGSSVLKGILEQPNAKVVALCDKNPDRLDKAATSAAKDNPATYTDWQKVLDRKDVDAIFIATPPYLHSEMAIAALQAGKHVYCEKPIGITAEQVRDLVKAAKASNKVFMAGQQLRSHKGLNEAIAKIHQGIIGDVIGVKAQRHATADIDHSGSSAEWYFDVTKSGGYLIEQSVHNVDACNWAVGAASGPRNRIRAARAAIRTNRRDGLFTTTGAWYSSILAAPKCHLRRTFFILEACRTTASTSMCTVQKARSI